MKKIALIIVGLILVNLSFGQPQNKNDFYTSLVAQLDTIHQSDQKYRVHINELIQKSRSESENMELINLIELMNEKDSINLHKIEKILDKHGWLGADVIGEQGNKTLFLVIQHSDLETQLKYLPMMREAVKKGDAKGKDFALLEDRIAIKQGNRQIYGSQIKIDGDEFYVYPIIEPEKVNERRAEVGLEPIEDYVKHVGIIWNVEKHKEKTKRIESQKEE
ncbi:MAG: DUF6624 domain-containing protein [Marinifilaceae bacterium]